MRQLVVMVWMSVAALCTGAAATEPAGQAPKVLVVIGAPGEEEFQKAFAKSAELWEKACDQAGAQRLTIGLEMAATNDSALIQAFLQEEPKEGNSELWLVMIGHGTFDGKEAKFNLRGPDISASDLAAWLEPFQRPLAIIDTSSSSGPFLSKLSRAGRVIVTATRSGYEQNYTRFGQFFSAGIANPVADLDNDGQVSLLEGFLHSAHELAEFYKTEGRLATEHPLIDDNGDGFGTPPDWFRGVRAVKRAADGAALDGLRAHQFHLVRSDAERLLPPEVRAHRNQLELTIAELRESKDTLPQKEYYQKLEGILLELARLYEGVESGKQSSPAGRSPDGTASP